MNIGLFYQACGTEYEQFIVLSTVSKVKRRLVQKGFVVNYLGKDLLSNENEVRLEITREGDICKLLVHSGHNHTRVGSVIDSLVGIEGLFFEDRGENL